MRIFGTPIEHREYVHYSIRTKRFEMDLMVPESITGILGLAPEGKLSESRGSLRVWRCNFVIRLVVLMLLG